MNKTVLLRDRKRHNAQAPRLVMTVKMFAEFFLPEFFADFFFGGGGTPACNGIRPPLPGTWVRGYPPPERDI